MRHLSKNLVELSLIMIMIITGLAVIDFMATYELNNIIVTIR
jgi:hypothetical protein